MPAEALRWALRLRTCGARILWIWWVRGASFFCCSLLRSMLAREREHKTCATVPGPRHRSNTTLSISRLLASKRVWRLVDKSTTAMLRQ
jgi:hypothetical protein